MKMTEPEDSPFKKGCHTSSESSPPCLSMSATSTTSSALNVSVEKSAECLLAVLSPSDLLTSPLHLSSSLNQTQITPSSSNTQKVKKSTGSSKSSTSRNSSHSQEAVPESRSYTPTVSTSSGMAPLNRSNSNVSTGSSSANGNEGGGSGETIKKVVGFSTKSVAGESEVGEKPDPSPGAGDTDEDNDGDDNSVTSDMSRGDNPSESYHTPSASIHNLANAASEREVSEPLSLNHGFNTSEEPGSEENSRNDLSPDSAIGIQVASPTDSEDFSNSYRASSSGTDLAKSIMSDSRESSSSSGNSTSKDGLLPGNYNSKPSKKKMWYHVFTPSYKTRSGDFRKNFKDLPADERLIVDYSCALQKEILVQGRMYVSQNYVSFYANIFGWQTNLTIPLKDITSITKENTALVIPNAIQVNTNNDKLFFTSFVSRDSSYIMLFKLWQTSLIDEQIPNKELWKLVHACYGEELGVESEAESEEFLSLSSGSLVNAPSVSTLLSLSDAEDNGSIKIGPVCNDELPLRIGVVSGNVGVSVSPVLQNGTRHGLHAGQISNGISVATDLSDSSDSEGEHERLVAPTLNLPVEIPVCPTSHDEGRTLVNAVIPCPVDQLFTMLFTNSKFYLDFHLSRKTFNIVQSDWTENEENRTVRQVSFTVTLTNRMGPKHSQVTESQVMLPVSKPGVLYAVDAKSVNAGIPYADAFYVTCHFCMSHVSLRESRIIIISQIKYLKSVWAKPFIESNTWAGLEEFYTSLVASLTEECTKSSTITVSPPPSPRIATKSGSLPRTVRRRRKGKAPDIPTGVAPHVGVGGVIQSAASATQKTGILADMGLPSENTFFIRIILSVLVGLVLLNAFLYVKLAQLETAAHSPVVFSPQPISFNSEMPQNHQEWLLLLQKQEALHRFELQKWHDILLSALKILHQAESDLESLKVHITSYAEGRASEIPGYFKTAEVSANDQAQQEADGDNILKLNQEVDPPVLVNAEHA